jgi:ribosomal protein L7/L12
VRFVDRDLGKEVALTHAIDQHLLSRIPSDVIFSGVALVRVKGQRAGSTVLVTTASHVVVYGKEGVIIWKQPLSGLTFESHGLDLVRLEGSSSSLEIGTGLSRRKELIDHLNSARRYSEGIAVPTDEAQEFDKERIRSEQAVARESSKNAAQEARAAQDAMSTKSKIEAREIKLAEQVAKTQKRSVEQKAREEQKIALAKSELESYGRKVIEEACAGKLVRIYEKGFVRVSGVFFKDGAAFEKLIAIASSADVSKKTALGRTIMFGVTMGLNMLTPDKRGDMYLTIATDRTTHMLHMSPPTEREMKAMHKIATAGQGVLDSIERQSTASPPVNSSSPLTQPVPIAPQSFVIDELTKLVALRDAGALSDDEFSALKAELIAGNMATSDSGLISGASVPSSNQEYFDVELLDAGRRPIETILVLRQFTSFGLAETKNIVDSAPSLIGASLSRETALQLVEELRSIGTTAELR